MFKSEMDYRKELLGRECRCPDGMGRITELEFFAGKLHSVRVSTYIHNRECKWDVRNVKLVPLPELQDIEI